MEIPPCEKTAPLIAKADGLKKATEPQLVAAEEVGR